MAKIVSSLEHRTNVERKNLELKLKNQLYQDILKLYTESIFADVFIHVGSNVLKSHRCLLQTRVPTFYSFFSTNPNLISILPHQNLEHFIKQVYYEAEVITKEEELLKFITNNEFRDDQPFGPNCSVHQSVNNFCTVDDRLSNDEAPVNCSHLAGTDNTAYYSLVDESLLLSDQSDVNEEIRKTMNGRELEAKSTEMQNVAEDIVQPPKPQPKTPIVEHLSLADLQYCEPAAHEEQRSRPKFFSNERLGNGDQPAVISSERRTGKFFKCFIDASDLIDNDHPADGKNGGDDVKLSEIPNVVEFDPNTVKLRNEGGKQTPDSLDNVPENYSDFSRLQDDSQNANLSSSSLCDSIDQSAAKTDFTEFSRLLEEKYECAQKNHAYSDDELARLKCFDAMLTEDEHFTYLKHSLNMLLECDHTLTTALSKRPVAVHKFLVKQYEKKFGVERTRLQAKRAINGLLVDQGADKSDEEDVDELLRKLLLVKGMRQSPEVPLSSSTGKGCGFFIDLKSDSVPKTNCEPNKEKTLPPSKQLFSMFIDFGNSTDSDSSMEVHNKFERRKKQYISKLEKSRELRNSSSSSLNETAVVEDNVEKKPMTSSTTTSSIANAAPQVVRRNKSGSPHPQELRRSWNVDKTANEMTVTKHKRCYSVTPRNIELDETYTFAETVEKREPEATENCVPIDSSGSTDKQTMMSTNDEPQSASKETTPEIADAESKGVENGVQHTTKSLSEENETIMYVKLSDMDKEPNSLPPEHWPSVRMTKSATGGSENHWFETKLLNGSANSRSLSRIFPDLSVSLLGKPSSDVDDTTTVSSLSSVQSSLAVSTCESNVDVLTHPTKTENTLGQDLLRMFLEEISTDVVVEVAGRRIKAHKCILTSRCQYFAALLSGGWVESAGNVLSIHGFSYNVVHFALCYIYCGESEIPETINIVELATLADYLCLEGLKEIVSSTLKMKYCHFFHKPCNTCSVGVLECLPIAVNYGLDDIHRKSLRWITKHYVRLWCSKAFAALPRELIDKCYNQHVVNMTVNNVFETLTNCDKLFSCIPQARWAEPCFVVTKKLHDYCVKFLANNFVEFLKSESFTSIATNRTWGITIMDEKTQLACGKMRSEQLCLSYAYLSEQCKLAAASHDNEELIELLNRVKRQVESALVKVALQVSQCSAWFQMQSELRNHIQTAAGLTFVPSQMKKRPDSFKPRQTTNSSSSSSRATDLRQVKTVMARQQRQNNQRSHETKQTKQTSNQRQQTARTWSASSSSSAKQNGVQNKENKGIKGSSNTSSKSQFRNKYANVKSRYMENKIGKGDKTASETTPSEMSEVEKRSSTSTITKRTSKSLASSVHLSPGIRTTIRAVSLSKIPISVRNSLSSQKRTESDTTSGSDNGLRVDKSTRSRLSNGYSEDSSVSRSGKRVSSAVAGSTPSTRTANRATTPATTRKSSCSSSAKSRNVEEKRQSGRVATRSKNAGTVGVTRNRSQTANGRGATSARRKNEDENYVENDSAENTRCPSNPSSKTSLSEEVPRPDVPFRRDGTFCVDEPIVLKKRSTSDADNADFV